MSVAVKRAPLFDALSDRAKRCRLVEALEDSVNVLESCPTSAAAQVVIEAATASLSGRRTRESDSMDDSEPFEKRARSGEAVFTNTSSASSPPDASRHRAETVVKALHGCPFPRGSCAALLSSHGRC